MTIVQIKAINDIKSSKGITIVRAGMTADVLQSTADEAVKNGDAELVTTNRKPLDLKKLIEKTNGNNNDSKLNKRSSTD